jgi:hypothetical protein
LDDWAAVVAPLCDDLAADVAALPDVSSVPFSQRASSLAPLLAGFANEVASVPPPDGYRQEVSEFVAGYREVADVFTEAAASPQSDADATFSEVAPVADVLDGLAVTLGVPECSFGDGRSQVPPPSDESTPDESSTTPPLLSPWASSAEAACSVLTDQYDYLFDEEWDVSAQSRQEFASYVHQLHDQLAVLPPPVDQADAILADSLIAALERASAGVDLVVAVYESSDARTVQAAFDALSADFDWVNQAADAVGAASCGSF